MVYFILDIQSRAIKIGFSDNPQERLNILQIANPNPLFLLGAIPEDEEYEKNLHLRFHLQRINGEWFYMSTEILWAIRRMIWGAQEIKEPYKHGIAGNATNAVNWLKARFRERSEWKSEELRSLAKQDDISLNALFKSPEVRALPILKKPRTNSNNETYWVWIAQEGWPKDLEQ